MFPLPPWLHHCLQDRIIRLLQVMHTAKYLEVEASYKNCHTDICFKTKTVVAHAAKHWTRAIFFQAFNSVIRSFTGSSSQCSSASKLNCLKVCRWCSVFTELTWNLSIRSKATWAKSFLMLLAYRKQIIQNQRKTVRRAVAINVCWQKSSSELFPLATTHAKVANSGKMVIARYRIRYFFQKRATLPLTLLEN